MPGSGGAGPIDRPYDRRVKSIELKVAAPDGLHARPAAAFVRAAGSFISSVSLENLSLSRPIADSRSLIAVLGAGVECGHTVRIVADGPDEDFALGALAGLLGEEAASSAAASGEARR